MAVEQKHTYFVLLNPKKAKFSFSAYSDDEGQVQFLWNRMDYKTKEPLKRRFEFSKAYRTIRVPLAQTMKNPDGELVKVVDFLRNHPECAESPNLKVGQKPLFKELNASKDAKIAIDARRNKIKAENAALELTGAQLEAVALACGYAAQQGKEFNENLAIHKCLESAAVDPIGFLKLVDDDSYELKAFVTKAVSAGVISKLGEKYMWGKILLGDGIEEAVAELSNDAQLVRGIQMKLNKQGVSAPVKEADVAE
jgi:hypothetical protein